jgi:hypothetical protein
MTFKNQFSLARKLLISFLVVTIIAAGPLVFHMNSLGMLGKFSFDSQLVAFAIFSVWYALLMCTIRLSLKNFSPYAFNFFTIFINSLSSSFLLLTVGGWVFKKLGWSVFPTLPFSTGNLFKLYFLYQLGFAGLFFLISLILISAYSALSLLRKQF